PVTEGVVGINQCWISRMDTQVGIVFHAETHKHPSRALPELVWRLTGMLQGLPGDFQQQTLLRVHTRRFAWRYPKKLMVKLVYCLEKAPIARIHLPRHIWIRVVVHIDIPARCRHFSDGIHTSPQQLPVGLWMARASRKPAPHTDDGDRLGLHTLHSNKLEAHFSQSHRGTLQRRQLIDGLWHIVHMSPLKRVSSS